MKIFNSFSLPINLMVREVGEQTAGNFSAWNGV